MVLLILIILVAAAVSGSLGTVLEIAAGVAIGLLLFVVALGLLVYYVTRYRYRRATRDRDRYV